MNFSIFGRIRPVVSLVVGMMALLGGGAAMALPAVEPVQALPLGPDDSEVRLLEVAQEFYGTSQRGGSHNMGTVYKVTPYGTLFILANFTGENGAGPRSGLTLGPDGSLYGTTEAGGTLGKGTVFRMSPAGVLTTVVSFNGANGSTPRGELTLGADGNFYGTTCFGGASDEGTIYRLTSTGAFTSLASFDDLKGVLPDGRLTPGIDGSFYGVCRYGGDFGRGTIVKISMGGVITKVVSFGLSDGQDPGSGLTVDGSGNFFGITRGGGSFNQGTVFRLNPQGVLTTLMNFDATNGSRPSGALTLAPDGNLYGTNAYGDNQNSHGAVFRVTPAGGFTSVAKFNGFNGSYPSGGLVIGTDGQFYGVTASGGRTSGSDTFHGVLFRMNMQGDLTTLAIFSERLGKNPKGGLAVGADGSLYGTASEGGGKGYGNLFRVNPAGVLTSAHDFNGYFNGATGANPRSSVSFGTGTGANLIYGTAYKGGSGSNGTVFSYNPATGTVPVLQAFTWQGAAGEYPIGPVVHLGTKDYVMTSIGGAGSRGTFVRIESSTATVLASFNVSTGHSPLGGPVWAGGSTFYASTSAGGTGEAGTIFKINGDTGELVTLVNFIGTNGATPVGELLLQGDAVTGLFYGTTRTGGTHGLGTVFKMTPSGILTTLVSFTGANGSSPQSGLAVGPDGNFYGTTETGGTHNLGTVYRITPSGVLTTIHHFDGPNGSNPWGRLAAGADGSLYGTTTSGGLTPDGKSGGGGQIFRVAFNTSVTTRDAASVSPLGAVIRGRVNPVMQVVSAFEIGTDSTLSTFTTYGSRTIPAGDSLVDMETAISGLAPQTTYYFRAVGVAAGNPAAIKGTILSFTTPASGDLAVDGPDAGELSTGGTIMVGNTAIGQNRDVVITLRNALADSMLTDLAASLTEGGGPFSITATHAATLTNGETTTLTVRFHPTTNGGRIATLSIASNDPDESPFTLTLRGWGGEVFSPVIDPVGGTPVSWSGFTATGVTLSGTTFNGTPERGVDYVILDNPGAGAVGGIFTGLPEGAAVTLTYGGNSYRFYISYTGGDGNDIVLRYWPETDIDPEDGPEEFLFAALDGDRDDKLTLVEWQGIYATVPRKEAIFQVIDTNHDSFLTFAEFTDGASNRTASRTIATAVQRTSVFLKVESSYDNIVTRAEIGFMWKPGTAAGTIDAFWSRANGGSGMDFWDWLRAKSLPSFTTFDQARAQRAERLGVALQLDADHNEVITRAEFGHLYPSNTKAATIDTAWRTANATARGLPSPASMTVTQFVEAAKLPKLVVY